MSQRIIHRVNINMKGAVDDYTELHLLSTAPRPVVDAAYRALSKLYTLNNQGNNELMYRLNAAYRNICRELDKHATKVTILNGESQNES